MKTVFILIGVIIIYIALLLIVSPVNAEEITGITTNNTIIWNWDYQTIDKISLDGIAVTGFVENETSYRVTFDKENSPVIHQLNLYEGDNLINSSSVSTNTSSAWTDITSLIGVYFFFLLGIIVLVCAYFMDIKDLSFIGVILGLFGTMQNSTNVIALIVYIMLIVASGALTFKD